MSRPLSTDGPSDELYPQPSRKNSGGEAGGQNGRAIGKELEENGEAEFPRPFQYFEDAVVPDNDQGNGEVPHKSDPLPKLYGLNIPPEDLTELESLEYYPLEPEIYPVHLLVVLPHFGNPYSVSIHQTRGNKTLTSNIIVNCKAKQVTRNLEVFLRHFRRENYTQVVWSYLQENGILENEKQITIRKKDWSNVIRSEFPTHYPIPLRTFNEEEFISEEAAIRISHEYVPLDFVAEEIRLVVILPSANNSDPPYAHFAHESIYGKAVYHCLSYTWGTGEATSELTLNGQLFPIKKNLEDALRSLRNEVSRTTHWIDAICIDQENVRERSEQVARMHQIYGKADVVLVWLGEADEHSDIAMDFIASEGGYRSMENPMGYVAGMTERLKFQDDSNILRIAWNQAPMKL